MTTARITYDSNNIDLTYGVQSYRQVYRQEMAQNMAASGVPEQINQYGIAELEISLFIDEAIRRKLFNWWWAWARSGGQFSFTLDSTDIYSTTLDGNVSGAVVPLTSTTGLAAGDECMVIADGDNARELIVIQSISAGVSVTATASLTEAFVSGDVFRQAGYWPALMSADNSFTPQSMGGDFYSIQFRWFEVLS